MSQILFYTGTQAQFNALQTKNENALYFLTDVHKLYKGGTLFTQTVEIVTSFPESGSVGVIYVKNGTYETRQWNGSAWVTLALPTVSTIGESASNNEVPTSLAVKNYVEGKITEVNSGVSGAVANVTYANKAISVQKGTAEPVATALTGFVDGASYNGSTGELSFTTNGGTPITVNLPVENFLSAASFNNSTNVLTLTLTSGETVTCNLSDLIDVYTGGNGDTVNVAVNSGVITATVNVSSDSGNILQSKNNGLYASVPIASDAGNIIESKSSGIFAAIQWNELS